VKHFIKLFLIVIALITFTSSCSSIGVYRTMGLSDYLSKSEKESFRTDSFRIVIENQGIKEGDLPIFKESVKEIFGDFLKISSTNNSTATIKIITGPASANLRHHEDSESLAYGITMSVNQHSAYVFSMKMWLDITDINGDVIWKSKDTVSYTPDVVYTDDGQVVINTNPKIGLFDDYTGMSMKPVEERLRKEAEKIQVQL